MIYLIIAIDNGNANTKTVHSVFTSGLTTHDVKPPMSEEIIKYKGKYYTLSTTRSPYSRDKTKNPDCFILSLFGIAKEIRQGKQNPKDLDIDLAVGLPPEHYGSLREKFAKYFLSFGPVIEFEYNDVAFKLNLKSVNVFPQAFAAVLSQTSSLKEYSRTYVVDIGGYTTDVLLLANGKPDLSYCRSLEIGIIKMNNTIKGKVSALYDMQIEEDHIYDVLKGKKTILSDDVKQMIREEAAKHTEIILNNLRELGIDLKSCPAIFIGGGSLLLKPFLSESEKTAIIEFVPDISANAVGYEILEQAKMRLKR